MTRRITLAALAVMFLATTLWGWQNAPSRAPEISLESFLSLPVQKVNISEAWDYDKEITVHPKTKIHYAIDFRAKRGTPVYAAADGLAMQSFQTYYLPDPWKGKRIGFGIGHFVQIWHPDQGVFTSYSHLDKVIGGIPYVPPERTPADKPFENLLLFNPTIVYKPLAQVLTFCKHVERGQLIGYVGDTGLSWDYEESPDIGYRSEIRC